MSSVIPNTFSHIGISVPDIDKAIEFYHEAFGWNIIANPFKMNHGDPGSDFTDTIYGVGGKEWEWFKLAHMTTPDRIGVELLQFAKSYEPDDMMDYDKQGIYHFGLQVTDVDGTVARVEELGGKRATPTMTIPNTDVMGLTKNYQTAFVNDIFGNWIELYSYSYELQSVMPSLPPQY